MTLYVSKEQFLALKAHLADRGLLFARRVQGRSQELCLPNLDLNVRVAPSSPLAVLLGFPPGDIEKAKARAQQEDPVIHPTGMESPWNYDGYYYSNEAGEERLLPARNVINWGADVAWYLMEGEG